MTVAPTRLATIIITALIAVTALSGCSFIENFKKSVEKEVASHQPKTPADVEMGEDDYFTSLGTAKLDYTVPKSGTVEYCDLDALDRAVCAYGKLTSSQRDRAQARGRQDINVDPAGWPEHNAEVDIPGLSNIEGADDYHGWMFNRSHMMADSLGGSPDPENLVPGTRTQNVGSAQTEGEYSGGMAHTEVIAREYLDTQDGDACPLYYAATPQYDASEQIPRTVIVDIRSCDKSIDERVEVSNTANGWDIDYTTGEYTATD